MTDTVRANSGMSTRNRAMMLEVARRLRAARLFKGKKVDSLALDARCSDQAIRNLERGHRDAYLTRFAAVCRALDLSIDDVLAPLDLVKDPVMQALWSSK